MLGCWDVVVAVVDLDGEREAWDCLVDGQSTEVFRENVVVGR